MKLNGNFQFLANDNGSGSCGQLIFQRTNGAERAYSQTVSDDARDIMKESLNYVTVNGVHIRKQPRRFPVGFANPLHEPSAVSADIKIVEFPAEFDIITEKMNARRIRL